jgi:hypothetical protein
MVMNGWIRLWVVVSALMLIVTLFVGYVLHMDKDWKNVVDRDFLSSCNCKLIDIELRSGKRVKNFPLSNDAIDEEDPDIKMLLLSKGLATENDFRQKFLRLNEKNGEMEEVSDSSLTNWRQYGWYVIAKKDKKYFESVNFPYVEDMDRAVLMKKVYFWFTALTYWMIASASLLGFGWSIAWIIAGFKTKKIQ